MQLLTPLKQELDDNYTLAAATEQLIDSERDMLQGKTEKRVMLMQLSTDVWQSVLNAGSLQSFGEDAGRIAAAYRHIHELNTVIDTFNRHGNRTMYTPVGKTAGSRYERDEILEILADISSEAATQIRTAQDTVGTLIQTECPVCETRFSSRTAMKSHITQKNDPEHQAYQEKIK